MCANKNAHTPREEYDVHLIYNKRIDPVLHPIRDYAVGSPVPR